MAKAASKAVEKVVSNRDVAPTADDLLFEHDAGGGTEGITARDLLIPRLTIIQALSPQLDKNDAKFIKGAEQGLICDVSLGGMWPSLDFVIASYKKVYIEWAPRSSGKGLVQIHNDPMILEETQPNEKNQPVLGNGNLIVETAQFYGFNLSDENRKTFIPMSSTQLKKAKQITTAIEAARTAAGARAPTYFRVWHLSTVAESNNDGKWYGWKIDGNSPLVDYCRAHDINPKQVADACIEFRNSLNEGRAKADMSDLEANSSAEGRM